MKKRLLILVLMAYSLGGYAQIFDFNEIRFWVGEGEKKALWIVDFKGSSEKESFVWGYKFDGDDVTAEMMINDVAEADPNLSVDITSGFLNDIIYLNYEAIGANPGWFATFNYNTELTMNGGIGTTLEDGFIFATAYTVDWENVENPSTPIAAQKPFIFDYDNVKFIVGEGENTAYLVADFDDEHTPNCYVWAYKFDGVATASDMVLAIEEADYHFNATMFGDFLNDLTYMEHEGLGGNPYYWMTFTLENNLWQGNIGCSEELSDNYVFGMIYTEVDENFNPINEPQNAVPASLHTSIVENDIIDINIYPNPTSNIVNIYFSNNSNNIEIYSSNGSLVYKLDNVQGTHTVDVSNWHSGIYFLKDSINNSRIFIKE